MATLEQIGLGLQGFGAGIGGQLPQFQQGLANRQAREQEASKSARKDFINGVGAAHSLLKQGQLQNAILVLSESNDPNSQQLANDLSNPETLEETMGDINSFVSRAQAKGELKAPKAAEPFTLGPGQTRFGGGGEVIASVDRKIDPDSSLDKEQKRLKLEETRVNIAGKRAIAEDRKVKAVAAANQKDASQVAQAFEAQTAMEAVDSLIDGGSFRAIYGAGDDFIPTILPGSVTAEAQRDQLIGLLSLESRQKLKGQGTISDSESKTLGQSATILARSGISEKAAETELGRVKKIFQRALNRAAKNPAAAEAIRASVVEDQAQDESGVQEGATATGPGGQRIVFRNRQWIPL